MWASWAAILALPSVWAIRQPSSDRPPPAPDYDCFAVSVRVRMAPSPTGLLHIGSAHTFLFNWLFARGRGGECLLRIENTDTSREVAEAVEQIERSLSWLGIDWDGPITFQLDAMDRCRELAARLVDEGTAYEDEGAIRFRMPDEGATGWEDAIRGRIEFPNEQLEDVVLVRSDGRPTYNFASPVEDMDDAHHPRDPRRRPHLEHAEAAADPARARPRATGVRPRREHPRHRRQEALEAPRRRLGRRVSRRGLHPGRRRQLPRPDRLGARRRDDDHDAERDRRAVRPRDGERQPRDVRLREARLDERRPPPRARAEGLRGPARPVGRRARTRLAGRARPRGGRDRAGEDRALRRVPHVRRLPLPRRRAGPRAARRAHPALRAGRAGRAGTVVGCRDRGALKRALRGARREAAHRLRPDPRRRHRLEDLARALREPRAPRSRADARADAARRGGGRA